MQQPTDLQGYHKFSKQLKYAIKKKDEQIQQQIIDINKLQSQLTQLNKKSVKNTQQAKQNPRVQKQSQANSNKKDQGLDLQSLQGSNQLMKKFKNAASTFGVSPQSIFRIADFSYRNYIQTDYFVKVLSKLNMGLSPSQISHLIYIFDQACTGFINKDDFNDSLNAYAVSVEEPYLQYVGVCLQKVARLIETDKLDALKVYQEMQSRSSSNVDRNQFNQKIKALFGKRIRPREIIGAFNAIDLDSDGSIAKKQFVYGITSALNKMSNTNQQSQSRVIGGKTGVSFEDESKLDQSRFRPRRASPQKSLESSGSVIQPNPQQNLTEDHQIITKLKQQFSLSIIQIYQQICQANFSNRLTLFNFKKILNSTSSKIPPQLSSMLFKLIDNHQRGSVGFEQLIYFYFKYQSDMSMILQLIGLYFKYNDLDKDKFWFVNGISADSDISKSKFNEIMQKTFGVCQESGRFWEKLWQYFANGKSVTSIQRISKEFEKYQLDP